MASGAIVSERRKIVARVKNGKGCTRNLLDMSESYRELRGIEYLRVSELVLTQRYCQAKE